MAAVSADGSIGVAAEVSPLGVNTEDEKTFSYYFFFCFRMNYAIYKYRRLDEFPRRTF